jgi:hypothetical protein
MPFLSLGQSLYEVEVKPESGIVAESTLRFFFRRWFSEHKYWRKIFFYIFDPNLPFFADAAIGDGALPIMLATMDKLFSFHLIVVELEFVVEVVPLQLKQRFVFFANYPRWAEVSFFFEFVYCIADFLFDCYFLLLSLAVVFGIFIGWCEIGSAIFNDIPLQSMSGIPFVVALGLQSTGIDIFL